MSKQLCKGCRKIITTEFCDEECREQYNTYGMVWRKPPKISTYFEKVFGHTSK